jgi:hypothetical protein
VSPRSAGPRLHLETERPQRDHVRLDGAGAQVAATGVGQLEGSRPVQQWAQEHDDAARAPSGVGVDAGQVQLVRDDDRQVVPGRVPGGRDADRAQHVEDPLDLDDAGHVAQRRPATVEQRRAQQRDGGILGGLHRDAAAQRPAAGDPQVGRPCPAEADQLAVQRRGEPAEQLEGQVLAALLDPGDGALAGAETVGELLLGEPAVPAGVADQGSDALDGAGLVRRGCGAGLVRRGCGGGLGRRGQGAVGGKICARHRDTLCHM